MSPGKKFITSEEISPVYFEPASLQFHMQLVYAASLVEDYRLTGNCSLVSHHLYINHSWISGQVTTISLKDTAGL